MPDEQHPGQRTRATVGDFDLSLADYVAGVPTTISSSSHHVVVDVPPAEQDIVDQFAGLRAARHQQARPRLRPRPAPRRRGQDPHHRQARLERCATRQRDARHDARAMSTTPCSPATRTVPWPPRWALTVKSAKLEVVDAGLADIALARAGGAKGTDLATTRSQCRAWRRASCSSAWAVPRQLRRWAMPSASSSPATRR